MAKTKATGEEDMELEGEADEVGTHGATNPTQVARHVQALDKIMDKMEARVKEEEVQDMTREALEQVKAKIAEVVPQMAEASVVMVLGSIKDPTCLAIRPATDEMEWALEEIIPPEDIPSRGNVAAVIKEEGPLREDQ